MIDDQSQNLTSDEPASESQIESPPIVEPNDETAETRRTQRITLFFPLCAFRASAVSMEIVALEGSVGVPGACFSWVNESGWAASTVLTVSPDSSGS